MGENTIGITLTVTDKGAAVVKQFTDGVTKSTREMAEKGSASMARLAEDVVRKAQEMYTKGAGAAQRLAESVAKSLRDMAGRSSNPINSMGNSLITTLGGAISKVDGWLTNLKTIAVGALAGWGVKSLADQFMGVSSSMEKMRLTLDTITKGGGDVWFEKLNAWALKMPVDTEKAIQSYTMMRGMGLKPTIDQMTTLVDTTSALGGEADTLNGIARALGQMQAKGKLSAEELMQLSERGVPAMEILKEKLHLTGAQVADIGNQAVSADVGIKALIAGMAERFGGQSAKIQSTWGGLMESLKGYWTDFRGKVMASGVMDWLESKIGGVVDKLDQMLASGELEDWAAKTGAAVTGALDKIWSAGKNVVAWWKEHGEAVKENVKLAAKIAWELGQVYVAAKVVAGYTSLAAWWGGLGAASTLAAKGIAGAVTALKGMAPVLALYAGYKLGEWLQTMMGSSAQAQQAALEEAENDKQWAQERTERRTTAAQQSAQAELNAMRATLLEDRDTLQARADQYKAYVDTVQGMIKKSAENEKKLVKELNDLYKQKLDLLGSTEDKIRRLSEIGMSDPQKYDSGAQALDTQLARANALTGQDQIAALEQYKADLASFAETWSRGVADTSGAVVLGGQDIINMAIANLQSVGAQQQEILAGLQQTTASQLAAEQGWASQLQASAQAAEAEMGVLGDAIAAIDQKLKDMQKTITVKSIDQASATIASIKAGVDSLHDKSITITTRQVTMYSGASAPSMAGPYMAPSYGSVLDSFAVGTNYVPQTGIYRLHEGEIVVPSAEAALVRGGQAYTTKGVSSGVYASDYGAREKLPAVETGSGPGQTTIIRSANTSSSSVSKKYGDINFNFTISGGGAVPGAQKEEIRRLVREKIVPELRQLGLVHA